MKAADLHIRGLQTGDREALGRFTCSTGEPWEDVVQEQIRGPLPLRYLDTPPYLDGRMLLGFAPSGELLVVGAHHIEPSMVPDVGYTEVIAVARDARGVLVGLPEGEKISLGHFMLLVIFRQMRRLGRLPRTFVRVDRPNVRSLALAGSSRTRPRGGRRSSRSGSTLGRAAPDLSATGRVRPVPEGRQSENERWDRVCLNAGVTIA